MSISDSDLIARVLADGDEHAFGELVRQHQSAVRSFLRRLARTGDAWTDDLAQETFVLAHRNLSKFRGKSTFSTWLLGIAFNRYRSHRRRQKPTEEWSDETECPTTDGRATQSAGDLQHDLAWALNQLPPAERASIHLCCIAGMTHEEAAVVLDCPLGTVKTHILRGKEKLRHSLHAWSPD